MLTKRLNINMLTNDKKINNKNISIMKKHFTIIFTVTALLFSVVFINAQTTTQQVQVESDVTVVATPEVYQLAKEWARDYNTNHPGNEISVIREGSGNIPEDKLLGTITTERSAVDNDKWKVNLCRQLMVPVIHANNPHLSTLKSTGISRGDLAKMFRTANPVWHIEGAENTEAKLLLPSDKAQLQQIATFTGQDINTELHHRFDGSHSLITALQQDKTSLAFLPLKDVVDEGNNSLIDYLHFLPIDRNNNGQLDYMEDIYSSVSAFSRGVWIGKYPKTLCCNVYFTASERPDKSREKTFISYLLTKGQDNLANHGYSNLAYHERQKELQQLHGTEIEPFTTQEQESSSSWATIVLILAAIIVVTGFVANMIFGFTRTAPATQLAEETEPSAAYGIDEQTIAAPAGLYFDKSHTWSFLEKDGKVRMGIDDFMQKITGPITKIKLKENGEYIQKGEPIATLIQYGKQITIKSPVSGTIHTINTILEEEAAKINEAPFSQGWLYLITPDNWQQETPFLKMAADYKVWLKEEFTRLKDFLAFSLKVNNDDYANVALQDGGSVKRHVLKDLGPEAWEDFQEKFIETTK